MSTSIIPVTLTLGEKVVFTGEISVENFLAAINALPSAPAGTERRHNSYPITVENAVQLLRKIDKKSGAFLKAIGQNNGEIDFKTMCDIFGISRWVEYSGSYGKGITRALRHMTDNSSATLVWWDDNEWEHPDDPNGSVYVDGQALKSLQVAIGSTND